MMKASSAALLFAAALEGVRAQSPFSENSQSWFGMNEFDTDGTTVLRDMKGHTGWTVIGEGASKFFTYQFSIEIEQYGTGVETLPDGIGFYWAFPQTTSTPAEPDWEMGIFVNNKENKVLAHVEASGPITYEHGTRPTYATGITTLSFYTPTEAGGLVPVAQADSPADSGATIDDESGNGHWDLVPEQSFLQPLKQRLVLTRYDTELLGLAPGKQITAQFSILNNLVTSAFSKGSTLRWDYEKGENEVPEPEEDDSATSTATFTATLLAVTLLNLIN